MTCGVQPSTVVLLGEYSGRSGTNVPVTFGVCCKQGDFTSSLVPYWGGVPQAAQVNVLRRHDDGSIRHALVTFLIPSLTANVVEQQVNIFSGTPATPTMVLNITAEEIAGALYQDEVNWTDGTTPLDTWHSDLSVTTAAALLDNARLQDPAATTVAGFTRIHFGPLMCEYEGWVSMLSTANTAHPWMRTRLRLRIYSTWAGARLDWAVENCPYPTSGVAANWVELTHFGELAFSAVRIVAGADSAEKYGYRGYWSYKGRSRGVGQGFVLSHAARYRAVGWAGASGEPPRMYTIQDCQYLADNHFIPKLDYTNPLTTANVNARGINATAYDPDTDYQDATLDADLTTHQYGMPMTHYPSRENMGASGASAGIGALPEWDRVTINSRGATNRSIAWRISMAAANNGPAMVASGSSTKRVHNRDPLNPEVPGAFFACGSAKAGLYDNSITRKTYDAIQADFGHKPHFCYLMYLLTGERFILEEYGFWCNHGWWYVDASYDSRTSLNNPILMDQDRYSSWGFRDNVDYVFICPDGVFPTDPAYTCRGAVTQRDYFLTGINNSLSYWAEPFNRDETKRPLHTPHGSYHNYPLNNTPSDLCKTPWGNCKPGGRSFMACGTSISMWQGSWWLWSLWNCWKKLGLQEAWNNFDWYAQAYIYALVDPAIEPSAHTRIGYNGIPYGGPISWSFDAPDGYTHIEWSQDGTLKNGQKFSRKRSFAEAYDCYGAVFRGGLVGGAQEFSPLERWYDGTTGYWKPISNMGELAWYMAVNEDKRYDNALTQGTVTSCSGTTKNKDPCVCGTNRGYPTPATDLDGDGTYPCAPEDWRVCGWTPSNPSYFYETQNWVSNANYDFGLGHACLAEAGIPGADQHIYQFYHPITQSDEVAANGFLGFCYIK